MRGTGNFTTSRIIHMIMLLLAVVVATTRISAFPIVSISPRRSIIRNHDDTDEYSKTKTKMMMSFTRLVTSSTTPQPPSPEEEEEKKTIGEKSHNDKDKNKDEVKKEEVVASVQKSSLSTKDPEEEEQKEALKHGVLRIYGPDAKGIVAAFSQVLYGHGCGIVEAEQCTDVAADLFFQRLVFDYSTMHTDRYTLEFGIREVCSRFAMNHELNWNDEKKKIAIMVSKYDHCLWELLLRHRAGELDCDIVAILSNHDTLRSVADTFDIPYHVYPVTKQTKTQVEEEELQLLQHQYDVDLVILARYMQIISDRFCQTYHHKVINIHHSFLPAFIGGRPYHRAHDRGVKLIGATAHYATADLDEGPIIEQDIERISHRDSVNDLIRKGRLLEKNVLVTAVKAHLEDRIIVYNNKCVIFD